MLCNIKPVPFHESYKHIFAKIPGGSEPPVPPSGSAHDLSAIETLICRRKMSLIGFTSFGFAQNMIHDFHNTVLNSY